MEEEKKEEPKKTNFDIALDKISETIDRKIDEKLSGKVMPKGYIRCSVCGAMIKENVRCPYCLEHGEPKEENMDDLFLDFGN